MAMPSRIYRNKVIASAKRHDVRVQQLYKVMQELNKSCGEQAYNIDHILPIADGGFGRWENIWIVPAAWNLQNLIRTEEMMAYIHGWIKKNGRICTHIPRELLRLERKAGQELLQSMGLKMKE